MAWVAIIHPDCQVPGLPCSLLDDADANVGSSSGNGTAPSVGARRDAMLAGGGASVTDSLHSRTGTPMTVRTRAEHY